MISNSFHSAGVKTGGFFDRLIADESFSGIIEGNESQGDSIMKKKLLSVLVLCLIVTAVSVSVYAEEEEFSLEDVVEFEETTYGDVSWNFPVDLFDIDPEMIVLANKQIKLSKKYVPDPLVTIKSGKNKDGKLRKASGGTMQLQKECAEALITMFQDAEKQGISLYLKSAYRSWKTQNTQYYNRLKRNNGKDDGWVAMPGSSDHQTGLGCDILDYAWSKKDGMNSKFAATDAAKWMAAHCAEYGFIIRYPQGKEEVTEINFEPWHLRYVGNPVAEYIMSYGLTLEEFHEQLQTAIDQFLADGGNESLVIKLIQHSADE